MGEFVGKYHDLKAKLQDRPVVVPETGETLERVGRYTFSGPSLTGREKRRLNRDLKSVLFSAKLPPEQEKTRAQEGQLREVRQAIADYAHHELGLDLSGVLPQIKDFHIFDREHFNRLRTERGLHRHVAGFHHPTTGIVLATRDDATLAYNASHESIHFAEPLRISNREEYEFHNGGFITPNGKFFMLNEIITEIINLSAQGEWQFMPHLQELSGSGPSGFFPELLVGEELYERIARNEGTNPSDVAKGLQRGHFLNQWTSLGPVAKTIGPEGMRVLRDWEHPGEDVALEVADALGFDEAYGKIEAFERGEKVTLVDRPGRKIEVQQNIKEQLPEPTKKREAIEIWDSSNGENRSAKPPTGANKDNPGNSDLGRESHEPVGELPDEIKEAVDNYKDTLARQRDPETREEVPHNQPRPENTALRAAAKLLWESGYTGPQMKDILQASTAQVRNTLRGLKDRGELQSRLREDEETKRRTELRQNILAEYNTTDEAGNPLYPVAEIASRLGTSERTVNRITREAGMKRKGSGQDVLTDEEEQVLECWQQVKDTKDITERNEAVRDVVKTLYPASKTRAQIAGFLDLPQSIVEKVIGELQHEGEIPKKIARRAESKSEDNVSMAFGAGATDVDPEPISEQSPTESVVFEEEFEQDDDLELDR